jgi:hypothetical protein
MGLHPVGMMPYKKRQTHLGHAESRERTAIESQGEASESQLAWTVRK